MPVLRLNVNGRTLTADAPEETTLLSFLRDFVHLTGAKYGCGEGVCGACTVLMDGKPTRACLTKASAAVNKRITTIEGLATPDRLHPIQQAFLDVEAFQCGFCTPGMIVASAALLSTNRNPTSQKIRDHLNGHLCRCGTYPRIVEAVLLAAKGSQHA
jgi:aerobic-type carbon monoxide dehydrogenase small subunit (CoxS/CutS family)